MLTSIFSSFDMFGAESLGQKVKWSSPLTAAASSSKGLEQKVTRDDLIMNEKGKDVSIGRSDSKPNTKPRAVRFAPEIDGVHCFETIIPC